MSTAIMSRYDLGDNLMKSAISGRDAAPGAHLEMGPSGMRYALSRMASTPASSGATTTTPNLTLILGNLTQQHRRLERAQSAPAPTQQSPQISPSAVNTSRYKTELCRPFEEFQVCKYGDKCQFAHGIAELRSLARHPKYKTELCRTYHTVGFCPYGPRCHFVHNQEEVAVAGQKSPPSLNGAARARSRPLPLSPAPQSLESMSPPSSLSQSPTNSSGSFFSSEPELNSPTTSLLDEQRLPVFNSLAAVQMHILSLSDLVL